MKIHRFIIPGLSFTSPLEITDRTLLHQMQVVLQLKAGETVALCDGVGHEAHAVIDEYSKNGVRCTLPSTPHQVPEQGRAVTLCAALLKRDNFELLVQKAVEIGVREIQPIITRRTVKQSLNNQRLALIAKEAAEQSGRGIIPIIHEPCTLEQALAREGTKIFFDGTGVQLETVKLSKESCTIYIGPEGGWETAELSQAQQAGTQCVSLAATTLRGETAAIVATYLAVHTL